MPTYTFKDSRTDETVEFKLRISELDNFKSENPHLQQVVLSSAQLVSGTDRMKPDDNFRDVLKSIKKASGRRNHINTW